MNNDQVVNRVEAALQQWRNKEDRFSRIFTFSLSSNRALLKEKLEFYERVAAKYRGTQDQDERFALKMLRQERNRVEKQLYPNPMIRLLRRILVVPILNQLVIRQDNKRIEQNSQSLHDQVQRAGFNNLSEKIDQQIKLGQQQFSLPVSYYINDRERLDHQLSFVKDQNGAYHFEGYQTGLYNESKPDEKRQQFFRMGEGNDVNVTGAYNLLSGRCIQRDGTWFQLDFNDKDAQGNYKIKQFHTDYGYDLEKILKDLPLKELLNKGEADKLREALKDGNRISVSFIKDGNEQRFYIEANPQFRSVNIYDEHSKKVTINAALGNKTTDVLKETNKVKEQQQIGQSRKNGMRLN